MSPLDAAAFVAGELRPGRPEVDSAAFGPLDYRPSATVAGKPFVTVAVHGEPVAQLSPRQLREHATGVLSAAVAAQLDQQLKDAMLSIAGLPDYAAARLVGELLPWRDRASELAEG